MNRSSPTQRDPTKLAYGCLADIALVMFWLVIVGSMSARWNRHPLGLYYVELVMLVSIPTVFAIRFFRAIPRIVPEPRKPEGLCPKCGYDLRASPERCPECGTANAAAITRA